MSESLRPANGLKPLPSQVLKGIVGGTQGDDKPRVDDQTAVAMTAGADEASHGATPDAPSPGNAEGARGAAATEAKAEPQIDPTSDDYRKTVDQIRENHGVEQTADPDDAKESFKLGSEHEEQRIPDAREVEKGFKAEVKSTLQDDAEKKTGEQKALQEQPDLNAYTFGLFTADEAVVERASKAVETAKAAMHKAAEHVVTADKAVTAAHEDLKLKTAEVDNAEAKLKLAKVTANVAGFAGAKAAEADWANALSHKNAAEETLRQKTAAHENAMQAQKAAEGQYDAKVLALQKAKDELEWKKRLDVGTPKVALKLAYKALLTDQKARNLEPEQNRKHNDTHFKPGR